MFTLSPIDIATGKLRALGWSYGEFATIRPDGTLYSVYARKDGKQIVEHRKTTEDAYRAVAEQAMPML